MKGKKISTKGHEEQRRNTKRLIYRSELRNLQVIQEQFVFIRVHWWLTPHLRAAWTVRAERWKSACRLNSIHLRNLTNVAMLSSLKESNGLDRLRPSA